MGKTSKKLKLSKIKHPNSRKADQLIKRKHKEAARDKKKLASFMKLNSLGEKAIWFRDNLNPEVLAYTPWMLAELIQKYLFRFDEEIKIINSRKSYQITKYASRRDLIKHTQEDETREFNGCGINDLIEIGNFNKLVPKNITHTTVLVFLKLWKHYNYYDSRIVELVPDILNELQLKALREWNGELRYLQNLNFVRYNKKDLSVIT